MEDRTTELSAIFEAPGVTSDHSRGGDSRDGGMVQLRSCVVGHPQRFGKVVGNSKGFANLCRLHTVRGNNHAAGRAGWGRRGYGLAFAAKWSASGCSIRWDFAGACSDAFLCGYLGFGRTGFRQTHQSSGTAGDPNLSVKGQVSRDS